jgi:hypothetical protein
MKYVGITGFMSRAEVNACLDALPAGMRLMCGVLASVKSLAGIKNKWHRRYPSPHAFRNIFAHDPRVLNLIHYAGGEPPTPHTICQLQALGGPDCHGFQFNGAWPQPSTLGCLSGNHVVLQFRAGHFASAANLTRSIYACRNVQAHVLIDASGGRGEPIDVTMAAAWVKRLREEYGRDVGIGIAGGLCAETLPNVAPLVRSYGLSIDAEGRLRDGDAGGVLNVDRACEYLKAAGELLR